MTGFNILSFASESNRYNEANDKIECRTNDVGVDLYEIMMTIQEHPFLHDIPEAKEIAPVYGKCLNNKWDDEKIKLVTPGEVMYHCF